MRMLLVLALVLQTAAASAQTMIRVAPEFAAALERTPVEQPGNWCLAGVKDGDTLTVRGVVRSTAECSWGSAVIKDAQLPSVPSPYACAPSLREILIFNVASTHPARVFYCPGVGFTIVSRPGVELLPFTPAGANPGTPSTLRSI